MKTKICCRCEIRKPIIDYNKKSSNKDGLERYCKECHRDKNRKHYANNKVAYKQSARKFKGLLKEWYADLKQQYKCERCGEDKPWRLSFHHTDPDDKTAEVSQMVMQNVAREKILKEVDKCIALCHNCHSDVHHEENTGFA